MEGGRERSTEVELTEHGHAGVVVLEGNELLENFLGDGLAGLVVLG